MSDSLQSFRKIGGGSLRFQGKIIKPNQVFKADPAEIPAAFRANLVPVEGDAALNASPLKGDGKASLQRTKSAAQEPLPTPPAVYELSAAGGGWYDVINKASGKAINDKKLRKADAETLMAELL